MTKTLDRTKDLAHGTAHPLETGKKLAAEADRGRSARTPATAITGVMLAVGAAVAVLLLIVLLVYYFG
jgi:hypothetical protein